MDQRPSIIGVGNPFRGDDGVGPYVLAGLAQALPELQLLASDGDVGELLSAFERSDELVLIDAVDGAAAGLATGTLMRLRGDDPALASAGLRTSTHAMGVAEAISLAAVLGLLPRSLTILAIAGECFERSEGLSPAVACTADRLIGELIDEHGRP